MNKALQTQTEEKMNIVTIVDRDVRVREYQGKRVVSFEVIDALHDKKDSTHTAFSRNKKHFREGEDYFYFKGKEGREALCSAGSYTLAELNSNNNFTFTLFTESGYLMLVKSFNDDLAWEVQRQLVNTYFKSKPEDTADMFVLMRKMIDSMEIQSKENKDTKAHLALVTNKVEALVSAQDVKIEKEWMNAGQLANHMNLFSEKGNPHILLINAIAAVCAIRNEIRHDYQDEQVFITSKYKGEYQYWEVWYKKPGIDLIKTWWNNMKDTIYTEEYYKSTNKNHKQGDLRTTYYSVRGKKFTLGEEKW